MNIILEIKDLIKKAKAKDSLQGFMFEMDLLTYIEKEYRASCGLYAYLKNRIVEFVEL